MCIVAGRTYDVSVWQECLKHKVCHIPRCDITGWRCDVQHDVTPGVLKAHNLIYSVCCSPPALADAGTQCTSNSKVLESEWRHSKSQPIMVVFESWGHFCKSLSPVSFKLKLALQGQLPLDSDLGWLCHDSWPWMALDGGVWIMALLLQVSAPAPWGTQSLWGWPWPGTLTSSWTEDSYWSAGVWMADFCLVQLVMITSPGGLARHCYLKGSRPELAPEAQVTQVLQEPKAGP